MRPSASIEKEETLDPSNWKELRQLGHQMVDDMMHYLQTVRERPVWKKPSSYAVQSLQQPLPQLPQKSEEVYEDFFTQVLPYNINNIHPRFWGWVMGSGTPFGMLADMLASGMNGNVVLGDQAPVYVENQVINWSKEIFGFPATSSGLLTTGASNANITALVVARNNMNAAIRKKGIHIVNGQMTIYGSVETHSCLIKGVEVIGIGSDNFRRIPVDKDYKIRLDILEEMISADRDAGFIPFCIVGNAGTVNTGAIDDLESLSAIATREKLWFHIDGAFGAVPVIVPEFKNKLKGLENADSLSFDFHKWFYMNYEIGYVLIKDADVHRASFITPVNYIQEHERGLSAGPETFGNFGMELSRSFKALKIWMLLKENGIQKYARMVRQNIEQAQYFGSLVEQNEQLELLAEVSLNIICYRFNPGNISEEKLTVLNKEILMRLHEEGTAVPSYTLLNGKYAIRVAITNHRSKREDFEILEQASVRIGNELYEL